MFGSCSLLLMQIKGLRCCPNEFVFRCLQRSCKRSTCWEFYLSTLFESNNPCGIYNTGLYGSALPLKYYRFMQPRTRTNVITYKSIIILIHSQTKNYSDTLTLVLF